MEIIRAKEKVILTAAEYTILNKAHKILCEIHDECKVDDGDGLLEYARDAKRELGYFLSDGKNDFYEVEESTYHSVKIECCVVE